MWALYSLNLYLGISMQCKSHFSLFCFLLAFTPSQAYIIHVVYLVGFGFELSLVTSHLLCSMHSPFGRRYESSIPIVISCTSTEPGKQITFSATENNNDAGNYNVIAVVENNSR